MPVEASRSDAGIALCFGGTATFSYRVNHRRNRSSNAYALGHFIDLFGLAPERPLRYFADSALVE
jgi:hypothetical protein